MSISSPRHQTTKQPSHLTSSQCTVSLSLQAASQNCPVSVTYLHDTLLLWLQKYIICNSNQIKPLQMMTMTTVAVLLISISTALSQTGTDSTGPSKLPRNINPNPNLNTYLTLSLSVTLISNPIPIPSPILNINP